MAGDLNRSILIGRLTKDPDLKYTQSGTAVCKFSLANNYVYYQDHEKKEKVSFFNCVAWSKKGEAIAEYCKKGQRIGIEGRLQQRSWNDRDGNKRYTVEIVVDNFQFLEYKKDKDSDSSSPEPSIPDTSELFDSDTNNEPPSDANFGDNPFSDEDIPF